MYHKLGTFRVKPVSYVGIMLTVQHTAHCREIFYDTMYATKLLYINTEIVTALHT